MLICAWDGWHDGLLRSAHANETNGQALSCASLAREPPGRVQNSALRPASPDSSLCVPMQESALASHPTVQLRSAQDDAGFWFKAATTLKSFMSNVYILGRGKYPDSSSHWTGQVPHLQPVLCDSAYTCQEGREGQGSAGSKTIWSRFCGSCLRMLARPLRLRPRVQMHNWNSTCCSCSSSGTPSPCFGTGKKSPVTRARWHPSA